MKQNETKKPINKFICKNCSFSCNNKKDYNRHLSTRKHQNETNETKYETKNPKNPINNLTCTNYSISCSNKKEYDNHLSTRKHHNETNETCLDYVCTLCECIFNSRTTLWRHKKLCQKNPKKPQKTPKNPKKPQHIYGVVNDNIQTSEEQSIIDKELLVKMMMQNQDFIKEVMSTMVLQNKDVMTKMMEIIPQVGNTVNNTLTNSNNTNHFNIQMFLNEHCKNAMNLTEFIESLPITAETYDNTLENGLTKSMTHLITNGLSQLDVLERPIHCTDTARKTLYIKENNAWEKDNELLTLIEGIQKIIFKQRTMLKKWQNVNEGWDTNELLQEKMTRLVFHSMMDVGNDEKEMGKIIRAISKNVYLDNDTKSKYL